jgi:glucokinase-like ROK family protein
MDHRSPADHALVRELNLSSVMRLVYGEAPLSRSQLAVKTGLNKSTISSLVQDLLERRLVHETGMNSNGAGRPATLLEVNPNVGAVIGIELGVDFVAAALIDFVGRILWRKQISADPAGSEQDTLGQTRVLVEETRGVARSRDLPILGLSFSIPGTVDLEAGVLIFAPNLRWHNVPFRKLFESDELRVFIENDANAAAVGEHLFGVAQRVEDFIFVFAGVGLGGGLFVNGRLYRGKGGYAGEIGHVSILAEPFQLECHCGNAGCWETYANQASIIRRVQTHLSGAPGSLVASLMEEQKSPLSIAIIKQAADRGDDVARASLAEAGAAMGLGFAGLVNIFNPQKIILGGPISMAGDHLMPAIMETVQQHAMNEIVAQTEIHLSAFGPDASLIGAAAVVVDDILTNPMRVGKEVMPGAEYSPIAV